MHPRFARPLVVCAVAAMLLTGCGESGQDTEGASDSASATATTTPAESTSPPATSSAPAEPAGTTLQVTVKGDDLTPKAEQIKVDVGEEITLDITADREGEFHVHSTPEQTVPFGPGKTTATLKFGRPGVVDVEEHDSHKLLVKFEVR